MTPLAFYGAGGHATAVLHIIRLHPEYEILAIIEDDPGKIGQRFYDIEIVPPDWLDQQADLPLFITIGRNAIRQSLFDIYRACGHPSILIRDSSSIIRGHVTAGIGSVILAGVIIQPETQIGENTIINTAATIDHHGRIGHHVHLAPGVHLAGNVTVGDGTFVGIGAVVGPGVTIGKDCVIQAGSVVLESVPDGVTLRRDVWHQ